MKTSEFDFSYPEELVAIERPPQSRAMVVEINACGASQPRELVDARQALDLLEPGDVLVINDSKVVPRRVFSSQGLEILFLRALNESGLSWEVLCPASRWHGSVDQTLPEGVSATLVARGRPQTVRVSIPIDENYFQRVGELPLPPYIQKARGERGNRASDQAQYQSAWAERAGSLAAPTASLHFSNEDLARATRRGVEVARLTLHVGLGTFLPVASEDLDQHVMHAEWVEISAEVWRTVTNAKRTGRKIFALGTTVTRALEAAADGKIAARDDGGFLGETALFITPGYRFQVVDGLLTNFHQPRSTLVALVAAFAGLEAVKQSYAWAIERRFRLFSYGDLSAWIRSTK